MEASSGPHRCRRPLARRWASRPAMWSSMRHTASAGSSRRTRRRDGAREDHPRARERVEGDTSARPGARGPTKPLRGAGTGGCAAHVGGRRGAPVEPWARRNRVAQEKLASGEIGGLAEIVRDGLTAGAAAHHTSNKPIANELFRQARKLLTAEIAACRGIEQEAADAWILQQVEVSVGGEPGKR